VFGLAHFHHLYEFRLTNPGVPLTAALLRSLFQLAFTTVFGAYATFIYLRSGSLLAAFLVHAFCNSMGLPRFWGRVQPAVASTLGDKLDDDQPQPSSDGPKGNLLWTVAYYAFLVAGAVLWWKNLWSLTASSNTLVPDSAFTAKV
jgi:prenyl protein peptidase